MNFIKDMEKIRIAVIGSGWVVENRHLPSLAKNGNFLISVIAGRKEKRLKDLADKYKIPKIFTGDAVVNSGWLKDSDAVMIGTDPLSHYRIARFCIKNGKHLLMEKPITTEYNKSDNLVNLAISKRLKFGIVHNFQYSGSVLALDKDLESGKLGQVKGLYAFQMSNFKRRLPAWYEKLPWGLFFDESPHLLYLLTKYAGSLKTADSLMTGSQKQMKTPNLVSVRFKSALNIPISLYMNFDCPVSEWYLYVIGEKGLGIIDIFRDIYSFIPDDRGHTSKDIFRTSLHAISDHITGTLKSGIGVLAGNYLCGNPKVVNKFARAILYNEPLGPIDAREALKINKLQFEIMEKAVIR